VRLGTPVREFPYRAVRVELLPEAPYTEDDPVVRSERRVLRDLYRRLVGWPERVPEVGGAGDDLPFVSLVNSVCMVVPLEAEERLGLLALDSVVERGHRACELAASRLHPGGPAEPGEHN
jgi:Lon protease-like protein